jgi:hypothetical protein
MISSFCIVCCTLTSSLAVSCIGPGDPSPATQPGRQSGPRFTPCQSVEEAQYRAFRAFSEDGDCNNNPPGDSVWDAVDYTYWSTTPN